MDEKNNMSVNNSTPLPYENNAENGENTKNDKNEKGRKTSFFAKLMCVITAFLMWFYVTGDQNFERTFTDIPVNVEDAETLKGAGLEAISNSETTAKITVSGKRSVVNSLKPDALYAYISLKGISTSQQYMLPIKVSTPVGVRVSAVLPESVNVYIDSINLRTVPLDYKIISGGVKDTANDDISPELGAGEVTIEGPNELVSRVHGAVAEIALERTVAASVDVTALVKLVDSDGNTIESEYISVTPGSVKVHIPYYNTKTVNVVPNFVDGNPDDYSYVISVPKLTLKTEERRLLEGVDSISTAPISLENVVMGKAIYELDIPEGVVVESGISQVEIEISDNSRRSINVGNITYINLDDAFVAKFHETQIEVSFTGTAAELINIKPSDFYCVADLSKISKAGEYEVFVTVSRSPASVIDMNDVHVEGTYKIPVEITAVGQSGDGKTYAN